MNDLFGILTSSFAGSLIGTIGAMVTRHQEGKQKIAELKIEAAMRESDQAHESHMAQLGNAAKREQLEIEQKSAIIAGEYAGLQASLASDKTTYYSPGDSKWLLAVDVIRGIMRPLLTGSLLLYMMIALFWISHRYNVTLTQEQAYDLLYAIINCLVTGANIALAWWFGSRSHLSKSGG